MDPPLDPDSMTKKQLQAELKKRGLKQGSNETKAQQLTRLKAAIQQVCHQQVHPVVGVVQREVEKADHLSCSQQPLLQLREARSPLPQHR
jgi:hypothetical protein